MEGWDEQYCYKQIGTAFYTGVKGYVIVGVNVYVDVDMDADADVQLGEFVPEHRSLVLGALGNILSKHYWMGKVVFDYQWPTFTKTYLSCWQYFIGSCFIAIIFTRQVLISNSKKWVGRPRPKTGKKPADRADTPVLIFRLAVLFLSPSGDLGIGLVWDNPTPPHHISVRMLKSSSNWTKLSMMGRQLFSGWYQMILDVQTRFRLGSD